jgi:hypothetical protein
MKQRLEPVHVETDAEGVPLRLIWRGRPFRVIGVDDRWRYAGKWWLDGKGWRRAYFVVTVCGAGRGVGDEGITLELFRQSANWMLSRECD